jgi:hypothetical protein
MLVELSQAKNTFLIDIFLNHLQQGEIQLKVNLVELRVFCKDYLSLLTPRLQY